MMHEPRRKRCTILGMSIDCSSYYFDMINKWECTSKQNERKRIIELSKVRNKVELSYVEGEGRNKFNSSAPYAK